MEDLQIIYLPPDELKPYPKNAKKHPEEQVEHIANSIREFGFRQPLVVDADNVVVIGHGRLLAAKKLGFNKVPVIRADDLSEAQIKALRLADNKTNESEWDFSFLDAELDNLKLDFDMADFGFDDITIGGADTESAVEEDDFDIDAPVEPKAKLGDIYQLGRHRLMCGDSTDVNAVGRLLDGHEIDMLYTDPPYGMNAVSKSGVLSEHYKNDILGDDNNMIAIDAFNMASSEFNGKPQVWWGANYYTECLPSSECWIVWDKNNGASDQTDCELAYTNFRSVVRKFTMASEKQNRVHPTQKPVKLFAEIAKKFDKEGTMIKVLDLFGGSGSTLIACEQLNRTCYMMELDPHYCDVIIKRWEDLTGDKAVILSV